MSADSLVTVYKEFLAEQGSLETCSLPGPQVKCLSSVRQEVEAAEKNAALFELAGAHLLKLTGADRNKFLHNFCTNQINALQPGSGCETFISSDKGRVMAHFFVVAREQELLLFALGGDIEPIEHHFRKFVLLDDVQIERVTHDTAAFLLTGPRSTELISNWMNQPLSNWETFETKYKNQETLVVKLDLFNTSGYLLFFPKNHMVSLWKFLVEDGILPAGADSYHHLRIKSGLPIHGVDITEQNLAQEVARTKKAISFSKGCYLGQETIARLDAMGHTNQESRSLRWDGAHILTPDSQVLHDDKEVGRITSYVNPSDDLPGMALGILRRSQMQPGTKVLLKPVDADPFSAEVFWNGDDLDS